MVSLLVRVESMLEVFFDVEADEELDNVAVFGGACEAAAPEGE